MPPCTLNKFWLIFPIILLGVIQGQAQLTAGSVVGTVKDPTGALVANAQITIKSSSTSESHSTFSSGQGLFTFPVVAVGSYMFTASAKGFRTTAGEFTVELNTSRALNIQLQLGQAAETVQVSDSISQVETTS